MRKFKEKICQRCDKTFIPSQWNQTYCGSKTKKTGCSYKEHLKRIQKYNEGPGLKNIRRLQQNFRDKNKNNPEYINNWKLQNKKNYAKHKLKRKAWHKNWRANNKEYIYEKNRQRRMKEIEGSHTLKEWNALKKKYNHKCIKCCITEEQLAIKWQGTQFTKLTRDHIIPISKGGTDNIDNIQPMCISCNASKRDKEYKEELK